MSQPDPDFDAEAQALAEAIEEEYRDAEDAYLDAIAEHTPSEPDPADLLGEALKPTEATGNSVNTVVTSET